MQHTRDHVRLTAARLKSQGQGGKRHVAKDLQAALDVQARRAKKGKLAQERQRDLNGAPTPGDNENNPFVIE